jgi:hypothetical protein
VREAASICFLVAGAGFSIAHCPTAQFGLW